MSVSTSYLRLTNVRRKRMEKSRTILFIALVVRLSSSFREEKGDGKVLVVSTLTEDTVEGSFTDLERGLGILFVSKLDSLFVTNLEGEPLLLAEESQGSTLRLVNIGGRHFIQQARDRNNPTSNGFTDYAVPLSKSHLLKGADPRLLNDLITSLTTDRDKHTQALQNALRQLLLRPEILLIKPAAFALGDEGITGQEYPSVLPFYLAALQLQSFLTENESIWWDHDQVLPDNRLKRASCLSECPPCPCDECLGMCGYGCNCWSFLCGDCCYHLGCYEHDLCCRSQFAQTRCLFPIGFQCESNYSC